MAAGVGALLLVVAVGWWALRPTPRADETGITLSTLVGKPAPTLQLPDAEGRRFTVPQEGRPTVLIFHMGFY